MEGEGAGEQGYVFRSFVVPKSSNVLFFSFPHFFLLMIDPIRWEKGD